MQGFIKNRHFIEQITKSPFWYNLLRRLINGGAFGKHIIKALDSKKDEKVLDICCGLGDYSVLVKGEYTGVDLNKEYIDYAVKKYGCKERKFMREDVRKIKFERKYFDKAMMINAVHHFSDEENLEIFKKVNYLVKKEFIIVDADLESSNFFQKKLLSLDKGEFIRSLERQKALVAKIFKIKDTFLFTTRTKSVSLCLIKCEIIQGGFI